MKMAVLIDDINYECKNIAGELECDLHPAHIITGGGMRDMEPYIVVTADGVVGIRVLNSGQLVSIECQDAADKLLKGEFMITDIVINNEDGAVSFKAKSSGPVTVEVL